MLSPKLYQVTLEDGRVFKVYCENGNQRNRFIKSVTNTGTKVKDLETGIHNIKQWEQIVTKL